MKQIFFLLSFFLISIISISQISLLNVEPWAYQLQDLNVSQVANNSSFQLIVMDYSQDGTDQAKYSFQQIDSIKNSGKYAISYLSIGEAEDYRYYWNSSWATNPPVWLGSENPEWAGNYKVKYWYPAWQNIIFAYIDTIISQGFDGIYLDIIDGYYYWEVTNGTEPLAAQYMCQFVVNIRNHVNTVTGNSNFIVIPQNGEDVWDQSSVSNSLKNNFFDAINAVGVEDLFFYGNQNMNNPYNPDNYRMQMLQEYDSRGKQIYNIEYLSNQSLIQQYLNVVANYNIVPYYCVRNLNYLCGGIITENELIDNNSTNIIFPNPTNGIFTIEGKDILKIEIYDVFGKQILELYPNEDRLSFDLQKQKKGIFFVNIYEKTKSLSKKLVLL